MDCAQSAGTDSLDTAPFCRRTRGAHRDVAHARRGGDDDGAEAHAPQPRGRVVEGARRDQRAHGGASARPQRRLIGVRWKLRVEDTRFQAATVEARRSTASREHEPGPQRWFVVGCLRQLRAIETEIRPAHCRKSFLQCKVSPECDVPPGPRSLSWHGPVRYIAQAELPNKSNHASRASMYTRLRPTCWRMMASMRASMSSAPGLKPPLAAVKPPSTRPASTWVSSCACLHRRASGVAKGLASTTLPRPSSSKRFVFARV